MCLPNFFQVTKFFLHYFGNDISKNFSVSYFRTPNTFSVKRFKCFSGFLHQSKSLLVRLKSKKITSDIFKFAMPMKNIKKYKRKVPIGSWKKSRKSISVRNQELFRSNMIWQQPKS